jgi:hypothetical protein
VTEADDPFKEKLAKLRTLEKTLDDLEQQLATNRRSSEKRLRVEALGARQRDPGGKAFGSDRTQPTAEPSTPHDQPGSRDARKSRRLR